MIVAGRGRSYPGLCTAAGERVGVIGALTVAGATRALKSRDVDGMIIGDGFGTRVVEALLTESRENRQSDLNAGSPLSWGRARPGRHGTARIGRRYKLDCRSHD